MQSYNQFICPIVKDDDGELCIEFSDELMEALDFKVGDLLLWEPRPNGEWSLKRFVEENDDETE
jgi:hypothetical protein